MYIDKDSKSFLTEEEIRKIDFEKNLQDLNNNKKEIIEGLINVQSISECLEIALNGHIRDVLTDLNQCWGYDIIEINSFNSLEIILQEDFGLKDNLCNSVGQFTKEGRACYEKLINLIKKLGDIIDIDTDNIITQLDKIEFDF